MTGSSLSRRSLLGRLGLVPAAATLASFAEAQARVGPPRIDLRDESRDLKPSRADLGSLFEQVERLAGKPRYPLSFLSGPYRDLDEFRARAKKHLFELLAYRPDKAAPKPEVIERVDRKDHVREKVVFSTAPGVRVPAYVLLPKGRRRRAPAIVDLHSHGGQFLF